MLREPKTAAELKEEVQRLVDRAAADIEAGSEICIPFPMLFGGGPDSDGCNWFMSLYAVPEAGRALAKKAALEIRSKWNLA